MPKGCTHSEIGAARSYVLIKPAYRQGRSQKLNKLICVIGRKPRISWN